MAQVGAIFAHNARGGMEENKVFVLTGLDKVKFKKPVEPGDQLRIEITCVKRRGPFWKLQGMASVDGKLALRQRSQRWKSSCLSCNQVMKPFHPTAIVDSKAELDIEVEVGAYSIIGAGVRIGKGSKIHGHVVIQGRTSLGEANVVYPFATIGLAPQDLKYKGEPSELIIGNRNTIREYVSLNPGTSGGGMVTRVGDQNLLMMYCHIAHDCIIGNRNVYRQRRDVGRPCDR
jgi:carbonic anhydrase/acetyltransferase-like protein (isoleucine patch superfamily)